MEADLPILPEPKKPWFEPAIATLLAVASLSTAWCSYQSALWSEKASTHKTTADSLHQQAAAQHIEANQVESMQMRLWVQAVDATIDGDAKLAKFYTDRFQDELRPAYEKWIALQPFENPAAPPHPFLPGLYQARFADEIHAANEQAKVTRAQAHLAAHHATDYLSITVVLATVLFFAGTSGKFDRRRVRWTSLAFAVAMFLYAIVRMGRLPVA